MDKRHNKSLIKMTGLLILIVSLLASFAYSFMQWQPPQIEAASDVYITLQPDYKITTSMDSSIWPANTALEQGKEGYLYAAMPVLSYTPSIYLDGSSQYTGKGTMQTKFVLQAVNNDQKEYWSYTFQQNPADEIALAATSRIYQAPAIEVLLSNARDQINAIIEETKFSNALFQLQVVTDVKFEGNIDGKTVDKSFTTTLPIKLDTAFFSIPKTTDNMTKIMLVSNFVAVPTWIDMMIQRPLPLALNVMLLAAIAIFLFMTRKPISISKKMHKKYKEWITEGTVQTRDKVLINVYSLEGVVDLAIDLDKRVIFDPDKEKYYVLEDTTVYVHDPKRKRFNGKSEKKQLGRIFLDNGVILPEQLEIGLLYQQKFGRPLGVSLMELGFIDEITLYSSLASQVNVRFMNIDPASVVIDNEWLDKFSINKMRALESFPLGVRKDGKLVIASANPMMKGLKDALGDLFDVDIEIIATVPSTVFKVIERRTSAEAESSVDSNPDGLKVHAISPEEATRFKGAYQKGNLLVELFLAEADLVGPTILSKVPSNELPLQWLVSNRYLRSSIAHLVMSMQLAVSAMSVAERERLDIPKIEDILYKANYITANDIAWVHQEMEATGYSIEEVLVRNHIVSAKEMNQIVELMNVLHAMLGNQG